jgi:hypothetical protein
MMKISRMIGSRSDRMGNFWNKGLICRENSGSQVLVWQPRLQLSVKDQTLLILI